MLDSVKAQACFHCGEPLPPGVDLSVNIDGEARSVCCHGCLAVAEAIRGYGLESFYRYRDGVSPRPEPEAGMPEPELYDDPALQAQFAETRADGSRAAALTLENIVCPACCWLVESQLSKMDGVLEAAVNYSSHHARVRWDPERLALGRILREIAALGYRAWPQQPERDGHLLQRERRRQLRRIALAGLLGMQVMMIAVVLYTGEWGGAEARYRTFFRWTSLFLTLPVVAYSAAPFFRRAWRDLRLLQPGMDVPVALGIALAFLASCTATFTGAGEVYFDSVVMFVFLLSLGRYLEFMARNNAMERIDSLNRVLPAFTTRLAGGGREESVAVARLQAGDRVLVRPGETVPADGRVLEGTGSVDEAILTGESLPVRKAAGETVFGGSRNIESPLQIRVEHVHEGTLLARIHDLLEQGRAARPVFVALAHRVAAWFVLFVLIAAGLAGWYWHGAAPARWIPITVAVLIVTCPCALSLAMPTAFASAVSALMQRGLAVARPDIMESLAAATHFVFDKTGTLTEGTLRLASVAPRADTGRDECLRIAARLEAGSEHPVARAIAAAAGGSTDPAVDIRNLPGAGVTGSVDGCRYYLGTEAFIETSTGLPRPGAQARDCKTTVLLADDQRVLAVFGFDDRIRAGAGALMQSLRRAGMTTIVLSGDSRALVDHLTRELRMDEGWFRQTPRDKLHRIEQLQQGGARVVMVGDGVNDAPVLAAADISIAMGSGTDLSRAQADVILLGNDLQALATLLGQSRRTRAILRQNLAWALLYNLLALPAAAAGLVLPWMAALGMSLSSLLVVLNSARLAQTRQLP